MIAEMKKLNLVAMSYDKEAVLNALQRTGAVEVKLHSETEDTSVLPADTEELRSYISRVEAALALLSGEVEAYNQDNKIKSGVLKDGFDVSYSDFMAAGDKKAETDELIARIEALFSEKNDLQAELSKTKRTMSSARIYSALQVPFSFFSDTLHTRVRLGTVPAAVRTELLDGFSVQPLVGVELISSDSETALICVISHREVISETEGRLADFGFSLCPFEGEETGAENYARLSEEVKAIERELKANEYAMYELNLQIRPLKIYCDYLGFQLEKEELADKLRATERTFLLEAYVPKEAEELVKEALLSVTKAAYFEFSEPSEDEMPPTLMKNNAVIKNFESVTNLYSVPNYREFDPNTVMAFFYSVFLGFIMGDIGYGLLMLLGGGVIWYKKRARDGGLKRLAGVFAVGGLFAVVWGILFNSFFGVALPFLKTVMPDAQNDMWTFLGIEMPSVLIISLLLGLVQLLIGYVCKAVQEWLRGNFWDGVWDGLVWVVFSLGVGIAAVGFIEQAELPSFVKIGGITAGVALIVAVLTAGRKEKFFGKFTKGFGSVYGIINYASDILSYCRIYGLMLSGAVIAQIVSRYAIDFITGGNPFFVVLGVLLMVAGHAFNLAMGLLGAYIHDARLQYVEFYGKFFEGEGELFTPLGSRHKYVWLVQSFSF